MVVFLALIKRKTNTIETKIKKYGNDENKTAKSDLPAAKSKFVLHRTDNNQRKKGTIEMKMKLKANPEYRPPISHLYLGRKQCLRVTSSDR